MLAYLLSNPRSMRNQNLGLIMFPQNTAEERQKKNQPRLITRILTKRRPTRGHHTNSLQVWAVRIPHPSICRTSICISSRHLYSVSFDVCYYETNKRRDIRTHTCKSQSHTRAHYRYPKPAECAHTLTKWNVDTCCSGLCCCLKCDDNKRKCREVRRGEREKIT